ncbi:MAG TPA: hypothetical protein VNN22_19395 [Verrucomicrobiae bacterium]|nr:hypothetical protein [Verrucomicrobiae bacterium]
MKLIRKLRAGSFVVGGFVALLGLLHAQETETMAIQIEPLSLSSSDLPTLKTLSDSDLATFLSELDSTPTIPADALPRCGTFWSLANPTWPPLPGNMNGLPVWMLSGGNGYLLNDVDIDYAAQASSRMGMSTMSMEPPGFDDSGTNGGGTNYFFSSYTVIDYGTNLWIAQVAITNGYLAGIGSNTLADIQYEIQSRTNLTQSDWLSEGFILGSEITNWTPLSVAQGNRTNLFIRLRSWADDGSGLPIWWQQQYGVSDPFGDPDGDGWNNLQEFHNGTNPTAFNTPAAPQLSVFYDGFSGLANVSWIPSLTPATNYTVERVDHLYSLNFVTNIYLSGGTESLQDSVPVMYVDQWDDFAESAGLYSYYRIQAHYAVGDSAWSAPIYVRPKSYASVSLVAGPQGSAYLAIASLPPGTTGLRVRRTDDHAENSEDDYSFDTTNDIPVSDFTNGLYLLPSSITASPMDAYGYSYYSWSVEPVNADGNGIGEFKLLSSGFFSSLTGNSKNWIIPPYFDGRVQLKQNLIFKLRAATVDSPFQFSDFDQSHGGYQAVFTNQPSYVSAAFFREPQLYFNDNSIVFDALWPFGENVLFRNFVYSSQDAGPVTNFVTYGVGHLTTGVSGNYDNYYDSPHDYPTPLILYEPPTYQFALNTTNGGIIPALLGTSTTRWLCSYPLDSPVFYNISLTWSYHLAEIGITASSDSENRFYTMAGNASNYWGLHFLSATIAYGNSDNTAVEATVLNAGNQVENVNGYFYPETTQPQFQTVEYDFWDRSPLPESTNFLNSQASDLLIVPVGGSILVNSYAKLTLLNGYPGVYAYLGQYFDKAYKIINGTVTTNAAGVLSTYGSFFATEPGPAALVTMPDLDPPYQRGTSMVYSVSLQLDKNHDGVMDLAFNSADATSQANPMLAWVNNGYTKPGSDGGLDKDLQIPLNDPNDVNYAHGKITCQRDLENFFRLWICGLPAALSNQNYYATLSCTAISNLPAINLYLAETNGGTGYLTDTNIAANFVNQSLLATISPTNPPYVIPFWLYDGSDLHFLFEGAGNGEGQFTLTVYQGTNAIAQTSTFIDLHDMKDFIEHPRATDVSLNDPPTTNSGAFHIDSYATVSDAAENKQIVIYVHGLNNGLFDAESSGQTILKRLYWQGYHGRYAAFRWPSPTWNQLPTTTNEISILNYNKGEYISWQSGAALKNYIDNLHIRFPDYTFNIMAVSEGGIPASEAVRLGAQVDNLVLSKVTVPAEAFDGGNSSLIYSYLAASAANTPDADVLGGYNNCFTNQCRRVNFYNDDDFACYSGALNFISWELAQLYLRPDHSLFVPGWFYSFDGTNCFDNSTDSFGGVISIRTLTDGFEKKSYVARSRTKAIGAAGLKYPPYALTGGAITNNISLQDASLGFVGGARFGISRDDHGGEFFKTIQNTTPFYKELLSEGFLITPSP